MTPTLTTPPTTDPAQLLRYRAALRELGDEAISCALYFTSVGQLHHMKELDLSAKE